jgi:hypothetical protein
MNGAINSLLTRLLRNYRGVVIGGGHPSPSHANFTTASTSLFSFATAAIVAIFSCCANEFLGASLCNLLLAGDAL